MPTLDSASDVPLNHEALEVPVPELPARKR
jgi:hypothetical protein